jgi:hypothetical protein
MLQYFVTQNLYQKQHNLKYKIVIKNAVYYTTLKA